MSGPLAQADKPIEPLVESIWDQGSDMLEPSRFSGVAKKNCRNAGQQLWWNFHKTNATCQGDLNALV